MKVKIADLILPNGSTIKEATDFCMADNRDCDNCPYSSLDACYMFEDEVANIDVEVPQATREDGSSTYKKVYICSPYHNSNTDKVAENIRLAREYCAWTMRTTTGIIPIAPHIYFTQFLDDNIPDARRIGTQAGLALLKDCEEVWVFGSMMSDGMVQEMAAAAQLGKTLRFFTVDVLQERDSDQQTVLIKERGVEK